MNDVYKAPDISKSTHAVDFSEAIDDIELAHAMARGEDLLRMFAKETLEVYNFPQYYETVIQSAVEAGEKAGLRFIENREREAQRRITVDRLNSIERGLDKLVTRARLAACAKRHRFGLPTAYTAFNRIVEKRREMVEHGLTDVVLDDSSTIRLDARTMAYLENILSPKQLELIGIFYQGL